MAKAARGLCGVGEGVRPLPGPTSRHRPDTSPPCPRGHSPARSRTLDDLCLSSVLCRSLFPSPHTATSGRCPVSTCISGYLSVTRTPSICGCVLRGAPNSSETSSHAKSRSPGGDRGGPRGPAGKENTGPHAASRRGWTRCCVPALPVPGRGGGPSCQDACRHFPSATVTSRDMLSGGEGRAVTRPRPGFKSCCDSPGAFPHLVQEPSHLRTGMRRCPWQPAMRTRRVLLSRVPVGVGHDKPTQRGEDWGCPEPGSLCSCTRPR